MQLADLLGKEGAKLYSVQTKHILRCRSANRRGNHTVYEGNMEEVCVGGVYEEWQTHQGENVK